MEPLCFNSKKRVYYFPKCCIMNVTQTQNITCFFFFYSCMVTLTMTCLCTSTANK